MAHVALTTRQPDRIDALLDDVGQAWDGLLAVAREWALWDEGSQLTYFLNWGVTQDRMTALRQERDAGRLSHEQTRRLAQVELAAANSAAHLEQLFAALRT